MLDATSEKKFLLLKKRLDALHYCQPFTIDSASLIERLLNDLIKTTEGFQSLKKINEELKQTVNKSEQMILPLKKENARLVQENNDLHFQMIKIKEEGDYNSNKWQTTFNRLDGERNDLRFLVEQKDLKLKKLEDENFSVKGKLDALLKKTFLSSKRGLENLPNEINSLKANTNAKFEISKPLRPNEDNDKELEELKNYQNEDFKNWAESLRKADERAAKFKNDCTEAMNDKINLEQRVKHLEQQIANRNQEINRLQSRLDVTGSNVEKISVEYNIKSQEETINKLNAQIDFLNKENYNLEEELKKNKRELLRTDHVRSENAQLNDTLRDLRLQNEGLKEAVQQGEAIIDRLKTKRLREDNEVVEGKNQEIDELRNKHKELSNLLDKVEAENVKLRSTYNQANQTISAFNTDKKAMAEWVEESKQKEEKLLFEVEKLSRESDLLRKELENQDETISMLRNRNTTLQRELDILGQNVGRGEEDSKEKAETIKKLRARINELEQETLALNAEKSNALLDVERIKKLKEHAEGQLESFKGESYKARANVDTSEVAKQRIQAMYEGALRDIDFYKKDNKALEEQLQKHKKDIIDSEARCNDYYNNLKITQEKEKALQGEIEITQDRLTSKIEDCRKLDNARLEEERKSFDLKTQNEKLQEQIARDRRLREDIGSHESERVRLLRRIDELEVENKDRLEQISKLNEFADKERHEKLKLGEKLDRLLLESSSIETSIQRGREREVELDRLAKDLELHKQRENELVRDNEKLILDNRRQENLIASGTRQAEHLNLQKDDLAREIRALKEELSLHKSSDSEAKTRAIKLQEKVNHFDILISELRDEKAGEERKILRLSEEVNNLRADLEREKSINLQLQEQIKQLKTLSEGLDRTREELLMRLQSKNNERGIEENERLRLQDEITGLKRKLAAVEQDAKEARSAMIQIDNERDHVQNVLDEKTEAHARLKDRLETQEEELRVIREKSVEFMAINDESITRVQDLEGQVRDMIKKNRALSQEINDYKDALAVKDVEIQNISSDLNILTKENQNLNARLIHSMGEKEAMKDVVNNVSTQEKMSRQSLRATEMERNDILSTYKTVCIENERLKRNIEELSLDNQALFKKLREAEQEISYLKGQGNQFEIKEAQYINEITTFERQITMLNRRLEQADIAIREAQDSKESLIREFHNIRHVSDSLELTKDEMHRKLVAVEQEKAYLNAKIGDLHHQNESLHERLGQEKRRIQQLEEILGEERKVQFRQGADLQRSDNEKLELNTEIQRLTRKITELQTWQGREQSDSDTNSKFPSDLRKELSSLKAIVNEKEVELSRLYFQNQTLREENAKTRMGLIKSESDRSDLERKVRGQDRHLGSTNRSDASFEESKLDGSGEWQRSRYDRDHFKRTLQEANISSHTLKEKIEHLQNEYREVLPRNPYKPA